MCDIFLIVHHSGSGNRLISANKALLFENHYLETGVATAFFILKEAVRRMSVAEVPKSSL